MLPNFEILTIQKFIFLLNDYHYHEFITYLSEVKASLPLKLVKTIRTKLPAFDTFEELCEKIYGGTGKKERQNFNQLTYYTIKLSGFLAQNYPAYLAHNYQKLQQLINDGDEQEAAFLVNQMLEIADKVEDFPTSIFVLKFLVQQSYLYKDVISGKKYSDLLFSAYDNERLCSSILSTLRNELNLAFNKGEKPAELPKFKKYFQSLHKHPSASIRILSKYALMYTLYYFEPQEFAEASTLALLNDLQKDMNNYPYLVFFFLFDIKSQFSFYKLNSSYFDLSNKQDRNDYDELIDHYGKVKYWKHYLNIPQIHAITIKASHFLSKYHYYIHLKDYRKRVGDRDLKDIEWLVAQCEEILGNKALEARYRNDFINLSLIHSGLLILLGGENIKTGIDKMEQMLITFQQINLTGSTDSIFVILMIGYFSLKNYEKCIDTYKRYLYTVKNKPAFEDNDIGIHTYYYLSKWLLTHRNQYLAKLKANYERTLDKEGFYEARRAMEEFAHQFKIPVELSAERRSK